MRPNLQFPTDLVTFIEEILNGKLHLLCRSHKVKKFKMNCKYTSFSYLKSAIIKQKLFHLSALTLLP